jgi:hypothetical protein
MIPFNLCAAAREIFESLKMALQISRLEPAACIGPAAEKAARTKLTDKARM